MEPYRQDYLAQVQERIILRERFTHGRTALRLNVRFQRTEPQLHMTSCKVWSEWCHQRPDSQASAHIDCANTPEYHFNQFCFFFPDWPGQVLVATTFDDLADVIEPIMDHISLVTHCSYPR